MASFGSKIGFITNCSTAMYAQMPLYDEHSAEYKELLRRVKLCRKAQGDCIDSAKGIKVDKFPVEWTSLKKCESKLDKELCITKKPYFQRYVYPKVNNEYNEYKLNIELYSQRKYGVDVDDNHDEDFVELCDRLNPVLDTQSTMNRICHYMESSIKEIKSHRTQQDIGVINNVLIDPSRDVLVEYIPMIEECLSDYKRLRKDIRDDVSDGSMSQFFDYGYKLYCKEVRKKIYSIIDNQTDIINLVITVCYKTKIQENKDFAWDVFGKDIFEQVKRHKQEHVYIPIADEDGDILYLGNKYSKKEVFE